MKKCIAFGISHGDIPQLFLHVCGGGEREGGHVHQ